MKALQTERLLLRPFTWHDMEETHRLLYADPRVAPHWTGRTRTLEETRESFARKVAQRENDFGFLAIVRKDDGTLIGSVALQRYEPGEDTSYIVFEHECHQVGQEADLVEVELTYALGRAYWGNGYATEAARAVIEYGFKELNVGRIVNDVNSENLRSIGVMRRLGFRLQKNLHPNPFGQHSGAPGIIGILDKDALWFEPR